MSKDRRYTVILLLAALVSVVPAALYQLGGDYYFQANILRCFAGQFWQGDLYPRWCMEANHGAGAPVFFFYFPLPYYIAALFYPLVWLGLPIYGLFAGLMALVSAVAGTACYRWLREWTTPGKAALVAVLFLFFPYRIEALLFRAAYAESWCIALMPVFFLWLRRALRGRADAWPWLAGSFAALCLSHLSGAAAAAIAAAAYTLAVTGRQWRRALPVALALAWGATMCAFYLVPAAYYHEFLAPVPAADTPWTNSFLSVDTFKDHRRWQLLLSLGVMLLVSTGVYVRLWTQRLRLTDPYVRREYYGWMAAAAVSLLLMVPVSEPVYRWMGAAGSVVFPWRMQAGWMMATIAALALWLQYALADKRLKTWKGDYALACAFLVLLSYLLTGVRDEHYADMAERIASGHCTTIPEYRTQWTDQPHYDCERNTPQEISVTAGKGEVDITRWGWNGIGLHARSEHGMTVRLAHTYFPAWEAASRSGASVELYPEGGSGAMMLKLEKGEQDIWLHRDAARISPWGIYGAYLASLAAALACVGSILRRRCPV